MRLTTILLAASVAWSVPARADEGQDGEDAPLRAADVAVLQHCHDVNVAELELARLALDRGGKKVQRFARHLIADHRVADRKVKQMARNHGQPVAEPQPDEAVARLDALDGAAFDAAYLDAMILTHDKLAAYLTGAINSAVTEDELRSLLEKLRPTVEKHARRARALKEGAHR